MVTVLADTAIRGTDLDEARALEAKRKAEEHIRSSHGDVDYAQASAELAKAIAKLRVIELTRKAIMFGCPHPTLRKRPIGSLFFLK